MPDPARLAAGKRFQAIVQEDFAKNTRDGKALAEVRMSFAALENVRQKSGRADILITELGDFVTILEIKATDWDRIKPANIKRNLYRHQRQLFRYVDKHVQVDETDVCLGIIYPKPPETAGRRQFIESYLEDNYGVPAYWYTEMRTPSDPPS